MTEFNPNALLEVLHRHGARYVLIGGLAAAPRRGSSFAAVDLLGPPVAPCVYLSRGLTGVRMYLDYCVVCTPNDLHAAHAALGLWIGADVILEKPPALSTHELEALTAPQAESGHAIHPVLQLRYRDGLRRFRKLMERRDSARPVTVTIR
jgi:Oxidoreductase family, NAD-binding Rossmann fold